MTTARYSYSFEEGTWQGAEVWRWATDGLVSTGEMIGKAHFVSPIGADEKAIRVELLLADDGDDHVLTSPTFTNPDAALAWVREKLEG